MAFIALLILRKGETEDFSVVIYYSLDAFKGFIKDCPVLIFVRVPVHEGPLLVKLFKVISPSLEKFNDALANSDAHDRW